MCLTKKLHVAHCMFASLLCFDVSYSLNITHSCNYMRHQKQIRQSNMEISQVSVIIKYKIQRVYTLIFHISFACMQKCLRELSAQTCCVSQMLLSFLADISKPYYFSTPFHQPSGSILIYSFPLSNQILLCFSFENNVSFRNAL